MKVLIQPLQSKLFREYAARAKQAERELAVLVQGIVAAYGIEVYDSVKLNDDNSLDVDVSEA